MSREALRALLENELRAFSAPRNLPVAVENRTFAPEARPWLAAVLVVSEEEAAALGRDADQKLVGFMQVDVATRAGEGTAEADALKDALERHFARRRLVGDGLTVIVSRVNAAPSGYERNGDYVLPVDVRFTAYSQFKP